MRVFEFAPEHTKGCRVRARIHRTEGASYENRKYPAVVICPGGGYEFISDREGDPVADVFYAAGYHTFILEYSLLEDAKGFRPLAQLAATIASVRENAAEWGVLPDKIAVCGFSAGGHLAASSGILYKEPEFLSRYPYLEQMQIRPDAMILGYPVITSDEYAHEGSIRTVSGTEKGEEWYRWFGLEQHVDETTPPAFLWHTAEDNCVPVENSLKLTTALSAVKVPFELHILPKGGHGMSVCSEEVGSYDAYNARWIEWCITWLDNIFDFRV